MTLWMAVILSAEVRVAKASATTILYGFSTLCLVHIVYFPTAKIIFLYFCRPNLLTS